MIAEQSDSFRGVAVTANNSDNLGAFGISFGFSGSAAVNLAGVINVENIHTSAHIGDSAQVNCGATCASNVGGANSAQSVRVAAANQYYELEVAASLAIGGDAGVAVPITVRIVNIDTWAYIGNGTSVNARNDVSVTANASESVIGVTAGAGGGTVGVAGTVSVTVLTVHTYACTGTPTSPSYKCAQRQRDDQRRQQRSRRRRTDTSRLVLVTVAVAGGYVGVGLAVGVAVLNKETEAYLGAGSIVNAQANGAAFTNTIPDGTFDTTSQKYKTHATFGGLAVVSTSSEDVFGLAPAVAGGFVGVAGGVGVTVMNVMNQAFIGPDSQINLAGGAGPGQSVNVTALDYFKSLTVAGGIAGGFVGVAGGVDVGIADTSAQAHIGEGSTVWAVADVEVNGLSRKEVQTYALSAAGGFVGVAIAVSVWSVGTQTNSNYQDSGAAGPDQGTWSSGGAYNAGDVVTDSFDGKKYTARCDIGGAWQVSTKYNKCRVVTDGGIAYQANVDDPSESTHPGSNLGPTGWSVYTPTAPHADSANWDGPTDALHSKGQDTGQSIGGADTAASGSSDSAPAWISGHAYHAGDTASFKGHVYKARVDITHLTTSPDQNSASTAPFNEWAQETGGYTSALSGTTSTATVNAWAVSTPYNKGDQVSYNGHNYTAKVDITVPADELKTPDQNTAQWANADSQNKTSSRISSAMGGAQTKLNTAASGVGGSVASNAISQVPTGGTTATIDSSLAHKTTVKAGGHVNVLANDVLFVFGIAGAAAGGFVGVGGSVLVLNVKSVTDAGVAPYATINAGGPVTVSASMDEHSTPIGFAGGGGFVGIGAQVAVVNDTGTQNAHIDDNAQVVKADGGLFVKANATRDVHAYAIGVSTGAGATGAAVAVVNVGGDATATIGDVAVGATSSLGGLTVAATDNVTSDNLVIAVAGGVGLGLGAAVAVINLSGTLKAASAAHGSLAGAVNVTADGTHVAKVQSVNVATGAGAVGITVDVIKNARNTEAATSGSGITFTTPAAVTVKASASNTVDAEAPGGAGGGVAISIIVALADLTGHTTTNANGSITNATDITISAVADNTATANVLIVGVSVIGLSGGVGTATIDTGADISATVGSAATLSGSGDILVEARTRNLGNKATASATGGSLGGVAAGSVMVAVAKDKSKVTAELDGSVTHANSLSVTANGTNTATASSIAAGLSGLVTGGLAASLAEITSDAVTTAKVGSTSSISGSFATSVSATGLNTATASSDALSASLALSIGVTIPTARIADGTTAEFDGTITGGTGLSVTADGTNNATAHALAISVGFVAGSGASSKAEITAAASVLALVGSTAHVSIPSQAVTVTAKGHQTSTADTNGGGGGIISIAVMVPTAIVAGGVTANFDGSLTAADHLTVTATGSNKADSHVVVVSVGIAAGGAGAVADSEIQTTAVTHALVGSDASVSVTNGVTVDAHLVDDQNLAKTKASGGGGGLLAALVVFKADAEDNGETVAEVAGGVTHAGFLTVTATGTNAATADTTAAGIGGYRRRNAGLVGRAHRHGRPREGVRRDGRECLRHHRADAGAGDRCEHGDGDLRCGERRVRLLARSDPAVGGGRGWDDGGVRRDDQWWLGPDGDGRRHEHGDGACVDDRARVLRGSGSSSTAVITANASVTALVGSTAHVSVPNQAVLVTAAGHQNAIADTAGGSGGVVGIAAMVPTALVGGGVTANFDGSLTAADHLTVTATASNKADAHTFVVSIGLASGSFAVADAEILSSAVTHALLGSDASVSVTNGITVDAHLIGPTRTPRSRMPVVARVACSGRRPSSRRMPRTTARRSPRLRVG